MFKKLFLLCIPCVMFFSCESTEHRYVLSENVQKSEAREYYEEKLHGIVTVNDYKEGKYMVAALDGSSSGYNFLTFLSDLMTGINKDLGANQYQYDTVTKYCPAIDASGLIYLQEKKYSFTLLEYLADDEKTPTGKYSFRMVAEKNADVKNFITEDASFTGDILTIKQEKEIFDPLVKTIVEELKEQDIFNKKSDKPESKSLTLDKVAGTEYNGAWSWCNGSYENSDYVTLQIDIPHFIHEGKSGSLYFYILQYNLFQNTDDAFSLVSVEGAFCYDGKKKFIYKDYDGKLKD
ncbi:MAG: hypothetical protein IKA37_06610 [Spirochaetales bacterium]|nr:hypothetical protein [Spirochaetales bacterium]